MLKSHDIFKQCLSSGLMLLLKIKLSLGWKEAEREWSVQELALPSSEIMRCAWPGTKFIDEAEALALPVLYHLMSLHHPR